MTTSVCRSLILFLLTWTLSAAEVPASAPARIVSLSPGITEIICQLGAESLLVGRSSSCDWPESVKKLPVAGDFATPNAEKILSMRPNILYSNDLYPPQAKPLLERAGLRVVVRQCAAINDYRVWVELLGRDLGRPDAARRELERVAAALNSLKKRTASIPSDRRPTVVWVVWADPLMIAGKGSLPDTVLELTGCRNAGAESALTYFKPSLEWLLLRNPDWLILPEMTASARAELLHRPGWKHLDAVKKHRVVTDWKEDELLRPGPRLFDAMARFFVLVHPEL